MEILDSRQLRAFQELAREGSFTGAARSLNLTQSAVSHSIKALEGTLETQLFERLGKAVRLTPAGEVLLPHVNHILMRMALAQDEIILLDRPGHGRLRVGATVTISQYVLPSVLRELKESFPTFDISVTTDDSRGLMRLLETAEIDVAVALETAFSDNLRKERLFEDEICMALSPMHPLASATKIRMEDLSATQFIFYNKTSETFRLLDDCASRNGVRLNTALQVGSMAAIKEMAKIGMGVGLLSPWIAEEEIANGTLVCRRLPWRGMKRQWAIHSNHRHDPQTIERIFNGICKNVTQTLQQRTQSILRIREN